MMDGETATRRTPAAPRHWWPSGPRRRPPDSLPEAFVPDHPEWVDAPAGRLGALICWENYMPQARPPLYAGGIEILVAPTYGMLCAEVDLERVGIARRSPDVTGHYARRLADRLE